MVIISQYMEVKHYTVHLKHTVLYLNYISIKLGKKEKNQNKQARIIHFKEFSKNRKFQGNDYTLVRKTHLNQNKYLYHLIPSIELGLVGNQGNYLTVIMILNLIFLYSSPITDSKKGGHWLSQPPFN